MFECRKDYILTGNGAAELINALMAVVPGSVGVIFPSFNEYAERVSGDLVPLYPKDAESFSYTADEIIGWADRIDSLVLINPDNPSGNLISSRDLDRILAEYKSRNKRLILDESFIDLLRNRRGPEFYQ